MTAVEVLPERAAVDDRDEVHIVCCRDEMRAFCGTTIDETVSDADDTTEADCPLCNLVYDDLADVACPFGGCCPEAPR